MQAYNKVGKALLNSHLLLPGKAGRVLANSLIHILPTIITLSS
jgi:hypothetical protein